MSLRLRDRVFQLLKSKPEERLKAREIAEWIHKTYPLETKDKLERSASIGSEAELLNQIVAEIGSSRPTWQKKYPNLRTTEGRPRRFYWTEKSELEEIEQAESGEDVISSSVQKTQSPVDTKTSFTEHDLYPQLIQFVNSEFSAKGVRIDETKSTNRRGPGGNKWLYPDVVALEALTDGLNKEVVEAMRNSGERKARLWSFEVKKLLNRSNVREAYFQSVSNSSWANFGYLVTAEIEGAETIKEIQMLYAVHGIGLIEIDVNSPTESTVRIPARERLSIEWSMCSRLSDENKDYENYMKNVRQFFQTGDL